MADVRGVFEEGTWCACCSEPIRLSETWQYRISKRGNYYCVECGDPAFTEFCVSDETGLQFMEPTFQMAFEFAGMRAAHTGRPHTVDLLCGSRAAAFELGELERYDEDPDASVTHRWVVRVEDVGRIA